MRSRVSLRPAIALGVLLVAGVWLWNLGVTLPDGKTHVEFLNTTAPATMVRTPRGARVLIDSSPNSSVVLSARLLAIPFALH